MAGLKIASPLPIAWMARIIARFREPHVRALVREGRFLDPVDESELVRILLGRREAILERYLTRLSPLTWPYLRPSNDGRQDLCVQDLAVWSGIRDGRTRRYAARAWSGDPLEPREAPALRREAHGYVCATLPSVEASEGQPVYVVMDLVAQTPGAETTYPLRAHLFAVESDRYRLVGLDRPGGGEGPIE